MNATGIITIPLHIGDFLSGTLHMDTLEKGAYIMLLLSHYQVGERGLPNDDKKLSRICGVSPKVWKRIRPVLEEKFTVNNDFWVSKKCVEVLRKVHEKSSAQRAKALKRHDSGDATAVPRQCQPKPKPKPKPIKEKINKKEDENFNEFWVSFPRQRRGSKEKAFSAYRKALTKDTADSILAGCLSYAASDEVAKGYAKGCAAWLNDDRWLNDYTKKGKENGKQSDAEAIMQFARELDHQFNA